MEPKAVSKQTIGRPFAYEDRTEIGQEMAEVANLGHEVFGDSEQFGLWMNSPITALGNRRPVDFLTDTYGNEVVITELTRIAHGILA